MERSRFRRNWSQHRAWIIISFVFICMAAYAGTNIDNLHFATNTISALNTNGNVKINPSGTGQINLKSDQINFRLWDDSYWENGTGLIFDQSAYYNGDNHDGFRISTLENPAPVALPSGFHGYPIWISTGNDNNSTGVGGETGSLEFVTGDALGAAGYNSTGEMRFNTGSVQGSALYGNTGVFFFATGNTSDGTSGYFRFETGNSDNDGASGEIRATTGAGSGTSTSGTIYLTTGPATANSGSIKFETGTSSATRGSIFLIDGSEGTSGKPWVSKASSGAGGWATLGIVGGGTNSTTTLNNNRVMKSSGSAIVEAAAITASRALVSDSNGIPTHATTTSTEIGYVNGVTSAIQTQINGKMAYPNVTSQSTTYSAVCGDYIIASGSSFTITLPTAVGCHYPIFILHAGSSSLDKVYTLNTTSSQTVGGYSSGTAKAHTIGELYQLDSDQSNWQITEHRTKSAPVSYSPTLSNTDVVSSSAFYWHRSSDGSYFVIDGQINFNGVGAVGALTITLPGGASIDTSLLPGSTNTGNATASLVGHAQWFDSGVAWKVMFVNYASTTTLQFTDVNQRFANNEAKNGSSINMHIMVPISGLIP